MTSKTTTKVTSPKASRKNSQKKSNRINRQRRLQKQLQIIIFERHSRRCIICHHPEREAIEEEFVHWRAPWKLSQDYNLNDYRTVYRHARAAGLLLQRRERLHSALDAFVESVDDVTFTGDTILRAMRAYSCIDSHGRWTEIPTQVQFSTSNNAQPPQPPTPSPRSGSTASDILDVAPKYSKQPSRSDATTCASPPAQTFNEDDENAREERVTASDVLDVFRKYGVQASRNDATVAEDQYDEPEDDDADADSDPDDDDESEEDAENELEELVTASDVSNVVRKYANQTSRSDATDDDDESEEAAENELEKLVTSRLSSSKSPSRSDTTAGATSPAQAVNVTEDDYADPEDDDEYEDFEDDPEDDPDDNGPKNNSEADRLEETTACAAPPAQSDSAVPLNSNNRGRSVTATTCADSPAQALPRDIVRGQNPNERSPSDRTDCAALPSGGAPAPPAVPAKPKPDADGLIWHPHPGYPNQERSEPDAQGRVFYKIHMTTAAAQPPSRQTDAQRAAKLIYGSVIKKYGNP